MKLKDIMTATREAEIEGTRARQEFQRTGSETALARITEIDNRLDRLAMLDPTD